MVARLLLSLCLVFTASACGDDAEDPGQDATTGPDSTAQIDAATGQDAGGQQDAAVGVDAAVHDDEWIGAPCTCTGDGCEQMNVPKPAGGTIEGCSNVPTPWTGAAPVCLRSYTGMAATDTFFANGFCSLMATTCTGESFICDSAVWGDYASFTACPAGSVLIADTQQVEVIGMTATIENKQCAPTCVTNADCRQGELDPVYQDDPAQYECVDKDGVKFCYDPRNLSETYTATAF